MAMGVGRRGTSWLFGLSILVAGYVIAPGVEYHVTDCSPRFYYQGAGESSILVARHNSCGLGVHRHTFSRGSEDSATVGLYSKVEHQ